MGELLSDICSLQKASRFIDRLSLSSGSPIGLVMGNILRKMTVSFLIEMDVLQRRAEDRSKRRDNVYVSMQMTDAR